MSDFGSAAERARRAGASVAKLERAAMAAPDSYALQINLQAKRKLVRQMRERLIEIAESDGVDLCDYRLIPQSRDAIILPHISESLLQYQYIFSQVYDCIRNGRKQRAVIGSEAWSESLLQVGYTYSGSFGVVLMAPGKRDFFEGAYDKSIDILYRLLSIQNSDDVRDIAKYLGEAVIKRLHDWSLANVNGGFDVDLQWTRSDGLKFGRIVQKDEMVRYVDLIESTSDEDVRDLEVLGALVGIDMQAASFHFVVPSGGDYRGRLHETFPRDRVIEVPQRYRAVIRECATTFYATGRETLRHELIALTSL